jgi:hypothetical protein
MVSCWKATQLLSKQMDDPLSIWEKFQLNTHLLMCWVCRRFQKHIILLRSALRELGHESMAFEHYAEIGLPDLSPEAKERILTAIRRQL